MKITVNRSARNSVRCQRSRAMLNLIIEHDGWSCYLKLHAWCDLQRTSGQAMAMHIRNKDESTAVRYKYKVLNAYRK